MNRKIRRSEERILEKNPSDLLIFLFTLPGYHGRRALGDRRSRVLSWSPGVVGGGRGARRRGAPVPGVARHGARALHGRRDGARGPRDLVGGRRHRLVACVRDAAPRTARARGRHRSNARALALGVRARCSNARARGRHGARARGHVRAECMHSVAPRRDRRNWWSANAPRRPKSWPTRRR